MPFICLQTYIFSNFFLVIFISFLAKGIRLNKLYLKLSHSNKPDNLLIAVPNVGTSTVDLSMDNQTMNVTHLD